MTVDISVIPDGTTIEGNDPGTGLVYRVKDGGISTAKVADAAITLAKMANLAQDQFIVRTTASTGVPQTATVTAAARTVLDDTTVAAMVDTLGGASATGTGGLVRATSPALAGTPTFAGATSGTIGLVATAVAGSNTLTLPAATDTLVGKATTDTLTNKTLTSPVMTTPQLGTPASGVLTNCTGLPAAGMVTGLLGAHAIGDATHTVMLPLIYDRGNGITVVSGTTYALYIGYTTIAKTIGTVRIFLAGTSAAAGAQTAEVAFASTPAAPTGGNQTLTKLAADGTLTAMAPSVTNTPVLNLTPMAYSVAGGVHLWVCVRVAMATTQPTFLSTATDLGAGRVLTATGVGALTSATSWTGVAVAGTTTSPCPYMIATTF